MASKGRTWVYDEKNDKVYVGNFDPGTVDSHTAHASLAKNAGYHRTDEGLYGGSVKHTGSNEWEVAGVSRTINELKYGDKNAPPEVVDRVADKLAQGDYKTVSKAGSVNPGTKKWNL
eukprot:m.69179 g.69179  ORF g.69179 m.69179 type:complete len:117 (+) comp16017_c0_seq1:621-971(+)